MTADTEARRRADIDSILARAQELSEAQAALHKAFAGRLLVRIAFKPPGLPVDA